MLSSLEKAMDRDLMSLIPGEYAFRNFGLSFCNVKKSGEQVIKSLSNFSFGLHRRKVMFQLKFLNTVTKPRLNVQVGEVSQE